MTTYSKTAALAKARTAVSAPIGRGTSWTIYGPYRYADISGPSTEGNDSSYPASAARRARWVARIALALMGRLTDDASAAVRVESIQRAVLNGRAVKLFNAYRREGGAYVFAGRFSAPARTANKDLIAFVTGSEA